jgi:ketosteroid isomerase-like protein
VLAALAQFNAVSARGDLDGFMAQFDDRADILLVGSDKGEVFKGRAAMAAWLQTLFKANGFSWEMDRVELSHHENTAWVFVEGKMIVRAKQTGQVRLNAPYRFSAVLIKRNDRWVWRMFHGSAPGQE